MNSLLSVEEVISLIESGVPLSLAGSEGVLDRLPAGNWIAGTIPYFMAETGGLKSHDRVFVTQLPVSAPVKFAWYSADQLRTIVSEAPENGFSLAIIPAASTAHRLYAEEARSYEGLFLKPIIGWIAGVDLAFLGKQPPMVYLGTERSKHNDGAAVAHVTLPADKLASLEIVNIFEQDHGPTLRFSEVGFSATLCEINGKKEKLADFLSQRGNTGGQLPLVGDFAGAAINVSIQSIDPVTGEVKFYAPVFPDVEYRLARPVANYAQSFSKKLSSFEQSSIIFSCNCILNYLYGELEGKRVGTLQGPVTFGEIAYMLLNQTLVVLRIT